MQSAELADISSSADISRGASAILRRDAGRQASATFRKGVLPCTVILPLTAIAVAPYIPALKGGALRRIR